MRTKTRRRLRVLVLVVIGVGCIAFAYFRFIGPAVLENWLGQQVIGIANTYLEPQLACESVEYEPPYTVRLHKAEWVAPDGTRVFDVPTLTITLSELPKRGRPIRIESVEINSGTINLVQKDDGLGFKGLSPIAKVKPGKIEDVEKNINEEFRLSNVLALRTLSLKDGSVQYVPASGDPPMQINDLGLDLNIKPNQDGAYRLVFDTGERPGGRFQAKTSINFDTMDAALEQAELTIDVNEESISHLPPKLQKLFREHEAAGKFIVAAQGTANMLDPKDADIAAVIDLEDFNVAFADLHLPIKTLHANVTFRERVLDLAGFNTQLLDGKITALGRLDIEAAKEPSEFSWYINELDLELMMRAENPDTNSKIAGQLSGGGELTLDMTNMPDSLSGQGDLHVRDGTLVMLPGLAQLAKLMNATIGTSGGKHHKADIEFKITPTSIEITQSEIKTSTLLARGEGRINYNGTLQINARGGPIERITSIFGKVGELIGSVTERGATYKIRGTLGKPTVSIAPLGVGSGISDEIPEAPKKEPATETEIAPQEPTDTASEDTPGNDPHEPTNTDPPEGEG